MYKTNLLCDNRYKYSTGVAWEGCHHLENMQLDNKSAVLIGMKAQNNMVDDAFREISEVSWWGGFCMVMKDFSTMGKQ